VVMKPAGGSWTVRQRFLSGGVDQPLAGRFNNLTSTKNLALVGDRMGTTQVAVQPNGTFEPNTVYYNRSPFGSYENATGSGSSSNTETGFTGASTPNQTGGFTYLRNRWYDPATGRFLTQDPIGLAGGVNLYAYAGNDPLSYSDPFGLCFTNPQACWQGLVNLVQRAGPALTRAGAWISRLGSRAPPASAPVAESLDDIVQQAGRLQGAGNRVFEMSRQIGELGLSQENATKSIQQGVHRLGLEMGGTQMANGVNYVLAKDARGGFLDAVGVHQNGRTTRALFRLGEQGLELVKDLGPIRAAQ
jgi:RHS repeat-associated protein